MNGGAQSYPGAPVTPTEEQIEAVLKSLEQRGGWKNPRDDMVIEVEYHLPDAYRSITGKSRAKIIAGLINELDVDVPALKDVRDDESRLGVVKAFLKTSKGHIWVKQHTSQSGDGAIADTLPYSASTANAHSASQTENISSELGKEDALNSAMPRELFLSSDHRSGRGLSGPPRKTRPHKQTNSDTVASNGCVIAVGVGSQSQPNRSSRRHNINDSPRPLSRSQYRRSNSNEYLPLYREPHAMIHSTLPEVTTGYDNDREQWRRQTVAPGRVVFVVLFIILLLLLAYWLMSAETERG